MLEKFLRRPCAWKGLVSGLAGGLAATTAAGKLAKVTGHRLSREQKKKTGPVVHYGFGTAVEGSTVWRMNSRRAASKACTRL